MLQTLAVSNYRSLLEVIAPLGNLNLITGANGSGKSNLYRALRLLAETAQGGVVRSLAREGGLSSALWAGPETISRNMREGTVPVQGGPRNQVIRLKLGFASDEYGYCIELGLPPRMNRYTRFVLDPEIKRECIWAGEVCRPASVLVDRKGPLVRVRRGRQWEIATQHLEAFDSIFSHLADPTATPEILALRERIRGWRFYDQFRTDEHAVSRTPQLGTRTPVLHHDGADLAAALQTIREIGDGAALDAAVSDAFPGARIEIDIQNESWFGLEFHSEGLLRPLSAAELSDGTLRYLLLVAALLTPRPPPMMILNEPETSLHPDLLPALARLIGQASQNTQVWVVSHAPRLIAALEQIPTCHLVELEKELGQTRVLGLEGALAGPPWRWPG